MNNILSGNSGKSYCHRQNCWRPVANLNSRMHRKREIVGCTPSSSHLLPAFTFTIIQVVLSLADLIMISFTATGIEDVIDKIVCREMFFFIYLGSKPSGLSLI